MDERDIERAVAFLHEDVARAHGEGEGSGEGTAAATAGEGAAETGTETSPERLAEVQALGEKVIEVLRTIHDPEIPVNIFDMGLVYRIDVEDDNTVVIDMTLTTPHCPVAETLPIEVERRVSGIEGVKACRVNIVWDPPWHPGMMSEEARLELGFFY